METTMYGDGAVHEWVEFEDPAKPGEFFRINVSFLLSNYNCIYGAGCPSIKADMPREGVGCCSQGVSLFDDEDRENVIHQITKLTDDDCANLQWIKDKTTETNPGWAQSLKGKPYKTRKKDGKCVFANPVPTKPGDPPQGCSFHVMAERTGEHFVDTKPWTCWVVPMFIDYDGVTTSGNSITTITAASVGEWGGTEPESVVFDKELNMPVDYTDADDALDMNYLAWWCIDTPDAYNGDKAFYKSNHMELKKIMGLPAYDRLCELMEEYGERRFKMPGELVNKGNPTIATISSLYQNLRERRASERKAGADANNTEAAGNSTATTDGTGVVSAVVGSGEPRTGSSAATD